MPILSLNGKRALVCGSSHGIGRACAEQIAELGADVTLVSRDERALKEAVAGLVASNGREHRWFAADFLNPPAVQARVAEEIKSHGAFQILINNTGGPAAGPIFDATTEQFLEGLRKHLLCNQLLVQTVVPGMKSAGFGRIINIISVSVLAPIKGLGVSNTTRGAVANWGRTLAGELAPFGITVNNILPGYTATERLTSLLQGRADKLGTTLQAVEEEIKKNIPGGRFADAAEIGAVVAFLAAPAASYVNGVNLPVDGGRTAVQ